LPENTLANAKALIDKVNREDIWKEAAKKQALPLPTFHKYIRGVEEFFEGSSLTQRSDLLEESED